MNKLIRPTKRNNNSGAEEHNGWDERCAGEHL